MAKCSAMRLTGLLLLIGPLMSCSSGSSLIGYNATPSVTAVVKTCPLPRTYTAAEKAQAKAEAAILPPGSELGEMIKDYSVLSQQARDCARSK